MAIFQDMNTELIAALFWQDRQRTVYSEPTLLISTCRKGVWIDIFPDDRVSNDSTERSKQYRKVSFLKNLYIVKCGYKFPQNKGAGTQRLPINGSKGVVSLHSPNTGLSIKKLTETMRTYTVKRRLVPLCYAFWRRPTALKLVNRETRRNCMTLPH